jgi:phosphonate transport system substrate-binding protein
MMAGAGLLAATGAARAAAAKDAASWAAQVPVIRIGLLGGENDADRLKRYGPYQKLLEASFGVPAKMIAAADYAGVIQAFAARQIDIAYMSPASYAAAWLESNGGVVPLLTAIEADGTTAYAAVMYVRADSGIADLAGMKGRSMAWADPNSASGYLIPRAEFRAAGIDPATYFSRTGFAGGHEQAVVAVLGGQYDAGVTWSSGQGDPAEGYTRGTLHTMVEKKMLDMSRLRLIWRSRPITNGPLAVRADTPQAFKDDIVALHMAMPKAHPDVFEAVSMGTGPGFARVTQADYTPFVDMLKAEAAERRRR